MKRELALQALDTKLATVLAALAADISVMPRNTPLATRVDVATTDNGKVIAVLTDGDPVEPSALLGDPTTYDHVQTAVLELVSVHADAAKRDAATDAALSAVSYALLADPTLSGACDYVGPHTPIVSNLDEDGVPGGKAIELPIDLLFSSTSPLG